jgi:hypothetical protein
MDILQKMFAILLAAAAGEAIIEFVFSPPVTLILRWVCRNKSAEASELIHKTAFQWLSALLGIGIALNFELGFFGAFGFTGHVAYVDLALTGALIGRGSNWVHDFVKKLSEERVAVTAALQAEPIK